MTIQQALSCARSILGTNNIEDSLLESEILLRHVLSLSRVEMYRDINRELTLEQEKTLRRLIERRLKHEPAAYITEHCEFYGIDYYVDRRVLIPRPETELLVAEALKLASMHPVRKEDSYLIAEVGVGSGVISVTLARHLPQSRIYAIDVSAPALEVAAINCQRYGVENRVKLIPGDLLTVLPEPVDLILSNLPYISASEMERLSPEIQLFEPRIALDGGEDGLDKIRQLCLQAGGKLCPGGSLLLEIGIDQGAVVAGFLHHLYPSAFIRLIPDWCGISRVVSLNLLATAD